jgi:parallel beta helix pectate lyase-like protein
MTITPRRFTFSNIKTILASVILLGVAIVTGILLQRQAAAEETPWPATPSAQICGNNEILGGGPTTAPEGAFVVPAGDNESLNLHQANTTYWFAPGVHTLGTDQFGQIIPGDNSSYLGAPGAILDGQNLNRLAFTQHGQNITIKYLEIRNFGTGASNNDEGVINHDSGEGWTIENNYVHDNDGAGVFLGTDSTVRYNCLKDNGQYGFSSYHPDGVSNVVLDHNEITGNNQDDWESLRDGCGCTGGGKFWDTQGAVVTNNWVHGNMGTGLWADYNNSDFLFENNYIEENDGVGLFYEISYNFMIKNNAFVRNALVDGKDRATRGDPFPSAAIYISESGGDSRAPGSQYVQSEITGNLFEDNWDGIALWENSDRFCRPGEEFDTTNNCSYFDETFGARFKTQNIKVHENNFSVDRAAIDCTNDYCARNAVFSNYGSYPATSPYLGTVTQEAITFQQNNVWMNNDYHGDWLFMPHDMGNLVNFATWQATPYGQDANSAFDGDPGAPVTPPTTPQTPVVKNDIDADTSSLEGSNGQWQQWYSAGISQSSDAAHSGSKSLRVDVTDAWGWGAQLANWPGFATSDGLKTLSFWGKLGAGSNLQPKMIVKWVDASYNVLQTDEVVLPALTNEWQNITSVVDAPVGSATALVSLHGSGNPGDYLYLDDMVVGDAPNLLDADSAGFENSAGQWGSWYNANVSASAVEARKGTGSMKLDVTDPWGWAIQTNNWPGFAASAGQKRVSFWAKQGIGAISDVTLRIKWFDSSQTLVQADTVVLNGLTTDWKRQVATLTAPADAATAYLDMYSDYGVAGDSLYIDDIVVANLPE